MKGAFGAREGRRGGSGAPASPGLTSSDGNFSPLARRVPVPVRRRERPGKPAAEAPTLAPSSVVEEEEEELEGGGGKLSNRRHRSGVTAEGGLCGLPVPGGGGEREDERGAGGRDRHRVQRESATRGESRGLRGG